VSKVELEKLYEKRANAVTQMKDLVDPAELSEWQNFVNLVSNKILRRPTISVSNKRYH